MAYARKQSWLVWLAIGLLVGFVVGGLWPDTPLHAVATDRTDNYAIATGFVDDGVEAVYFLDFLTGTLRAKVLSNQAAGFQAHFDGNVNRDLAAFLQLRNANLTQTNSQRRRQGMPPLPELELPQSPSYLMVTGSIDMRRGAAARALPASSALYVAETTTGVVLTYLLMWDRNAHNANQPSGGVLQLWTADQFTAALQTTE